MLQLIREESDDEGEDKGTCPRRDAVQLGADLRIAVRSDDAGGEEGVAVGFNIPGSAYLILENKWAPRHV